MATCGGCAGARPARAEHRDSVYLTSFLQFLGVATSIRLNKMHSLSRELAHGNQSRCKKTEVITLSAE